MRYRCRMSSLYVQSTNGLIRNFAILRYVLLYPAHREGPDKTARMRRLTLAIAVCKYPKTSLAWGSPNVFEYLHEIIYAEVFTRTFNEYPQYMFSWKSK